MMSKSSWIVILCLLLCFITPAVAQTPPPAKEQAKKDKEITAPTRFQDAKELFLKAYQCEKEQQYEQALKNYDATLLFFRGSKEPHAKYTKIVLNNMAGINAKLGKLDEAIRLYEEALRLATVENDYKSRGEFYHKLGLIFDHIAKAKAAEAEQKNIIRPKKNKKDIGGVLMRDSTYTSLMQVNRDFVANRIRVEGSYNPFEDKKELYTKLVNIKLKGDFDPSSLLVPDSVEYILQFRKRGYYTLPKQGTLLPKMEYNELNEIMVAIPRKVKPEITEDFYRQGIVTPDTITLTPIVGNQTQGKPLAITDKETFKPGHYQLFIQKSGYNQIVEQMTLYPGEGSFVLQRELASKLRAITYDIRGDFTALGTDEVEPDELSLSSQLINKDSKVKPAEYKLVIKEEGYEPVSEKIVIPPDERPYLISKYMKTLPREVIFRITGDYQQDDELTPDEVTMGGRFLKYGDSVRPDAYRVVIRKKGYDPVTERLIIKPKNEPYILQKGLKSTPRRIQANILAHFPKNLRIFPDKCTLNNKPALDESFKPGEYELFIKRAGYKPIEETVNIAPDDIPYMLQKIMYPKDVKIALTITQDIPPEDKDAKPKSVLNSEKTRELIEIEDGSMVQPEIYTLKITMPGYEPALTKEPIMPSEIPYKIDRRLSASLRSVIKQITAEYPLNEPIQPDEITIDNKAVGKDFQIKPGVHDLVIIKEGYLPIRKQIKVLASPKEYLLIERLDTSSRLVTFVFRDSYDRRILSPSEAMLDKDRLAHNTPRSLKPGEYQLNVRKRGYAALSETVLIPVGAGPYKVERFLKAIKRDVIADITGDYKPDEKLIPDSFTLSDKPMAERATVKPGVYQMNIQKAGYYPILKRINIVPDPKPYLIKEQLISKPRQVRVIIKSSFNDKQIVVDTLTFGTENIKDGQEIKPGTYALNIKKKGYKPLSDQIIIEPSEQPFTLERTLEALPVLVLYKITNDYDDQPVIPDVISLNEKIVDQKTSFLPGTYTTKIEKLGFNAKQFDVVIEPSDQAYTIETQLESKPREIELYATMAFPPDEPIDPEVAALNTKDVRDNIFKPGNYKLDLQHPGFFPIQEDISIEPGEQPFVIERILKGKPRVLKERIDYDVLPPEELGPYKITFAPVEDPKAERVVKEGDTVDPGAYVMRISKEAYELVETKRYVWAEELPEIIEEMLIAKQVVIHINITYDVQPPADLPDYKVSLIDKETGIARFVSHGKRIKPGNYLLDIQRPGYSFGAKKEVEIQPSEEPYQINEKLLAKERNISFDMIYKGLMVSAHKIINKVTGQEVTFKDTFDPGEELDLIVKFKKYATVDKRFKIVPGEGPFVASVPLKQLKRRDFMTRKDHVVLDGIKYPYKFEAGGKRIEDHLITLKQTPGRRFMGEIWLTPEVKHLQVFGGYMFVQKNVNFLGMITRLNSISVPKLIEHLDKVGKGDRGLRGALDVLEKLLRSYSVKRNLKKAHAKEIENLMQYVEGWKLLDARDRVRKGVCLDILDKLK